MEVIERLRKKLEELEESLSHLWRGGGSQGKQILEYKKKIINYLIDAYQSEPVLADLSEAERILNQQVGFEEQKRKILESVEIAQFRPLILCLIGPTGTGKTTFAQLLAQVLKKKYFSVALGGLSNTSLLTGTGENSSGTAMGQLAKALAETKTHDPLILLDEIDKTKPALQDCLLNVLDSVQNHEILDHYLDVKLDFSRATFVITANDRKKVSEQLLSRMLVIELPGYNNGQKQEIANQVIQKWFEQNASLDRNKFEITSEAVETLINKTKEKGVRQLKSALDSVFDYCLLQWTRETRSGAEESKITIDDNLVNQIIPHDFPNIDQEENPEDPPENYKRQIEILKKELETLREEKNTQIQLKAVKFNALLILRQVREKFKVEEYQNYEGKINLATSREEIEVIEKEFLLQIKQKNALSKPTENNNDKAKLNKLSEIEQLISKLEQQLRTSQQLANMEIDKLKKELENLRKQKPEKLNWNIKNNPWFFLFIIILLMGGFYIIFNFKKRRTKTKKIFKKP